MTFSLVLASDLAALIPFVTFSIADVSCLTALDQGSELPREARAPVRVSPNTTNRGALLPRLAGPPPSTRCPVSAFV